MNLNTSVILGFVGACVMFLGDMILYFDKRDFKGGDPKEGIIAIMKNVDVRRLYIGGLAGPFAAFLYCLGFYHLLLIFKDQYTTVAWILILINVLGIILGGAYHSHCAYLGLISRHEQGKVFEEFIKFLEFQAKIILPIIGLGSLGVTLSIALGFTILPRWFAVFTPTVLIFLSPIMDKLPKGLHMVIRGGWNNLVYVIYYLLVLLWLAV